MELDQVSSDGDRSFLTCSPEAPQHHDTSWALFDAIDRKDLRHFVTELDEAIKENSLRSFYDGDRTLFQYSCIVEDRHEFANELMQRKFCPNETGPTDTRMPFLLAAEYGRFFIIQMLLDNEETILGAVDIRKGMQTAIHKVVLMKRHGDTYSDYMACLDAMLNFMNENEGKKNLRGLDINAMDFKGNTPLHYAAAKLKNGGEIEKEMVLKLLRAGSDIGIQNDDNEAAFRRIPADLLESFMDECITTNGKEAFEKDFKLIFRYKFLIPSRARPGCIEDQFNRYVEEPLLMISESDDHRRLLKHPILASCIYLMWFRIRWIFLANFSMYAIYVLLMTIYIMELIEVGNKYTKLVCCKSPLMPLLLFSLCTKECIHIFMSMGKYMKIPINRPKPLLVLLSGVLLWANAEKYVTYQIATVTILLMWIELALILGQHPRFITYVIMFKTVAVNFFFFIAVYFFIILAFSFCFFILFHDADMELKRRIALRNGTSFHYFTSIWMTFIKTCLMMLGEFELSSLRFSEYQFLSQTIFLAFVVLISLVLINLINGLAVSDTQAIMEKAEIIGYVSQIEVFSQMEAMMLDVPRLVHLFTCCFVWRGRDLCKLRNFGPWGKTVRLGFCGWTHVFWKWKEIEVEVNHGGLIQHCVCIRCTPRSVNRWMDSRVIKRAILITSRKSKGKTLDDIWKSLKNIENLLLSIKEANGSMAETSQFHVPTIRVERVLD